MPTQSASLEHIGQRVLGRLVLSNVLAPAAARLHARAVLARTRPLQRRAHLRTEPAKLYYCRALSSLKHRGTLTALLAARAPTSIC